MRLLLVEDDAMIGEAVLHVLRAEHYAVDWVRDGVMAEEALKSEQYDLVLLDLGLPKREALDLALARKPGPAGGVVVRGIQAAIFPCTCGKARPPAHQ